VTAAGAMMKDAIKGTITDTTMALNKATTVDRTI
jgi:hypothetical protein